jgi:hypothetical protein
MPFVGLRVYVRGAGETASDNDPAVGPAAECSPNRVALTDSEGVATCNVRLFGRTVNATLLLNIGEFSVRTILLQVNPGLRIINGDNQSAM